MIIASFRSGSANYYRIGFPEGEIVQLTDEPEIQGYSGIISPDGTDLLYTTGGTMRGVNLETLATRDALGVCWWASSVSSPSAQTTPPWWLP